MYLITINIEGKTNYIDYLENYFDARAVACLWNDATITKCESINDGLFQLNK